MLKRLLACPTTSAENDRYRTIGFVAFVAVETLMLVVFVFSALELLGLSVAALILQLLALAVQLFCALQSYRYLRYQQQPSIVGPPDDLMTDSDRIASDDK